jgi:hypothetical protein
MKRLSWSPSQSTREATAGPDVVVSVSAPPEGGKPAEVAGLEALTNARGVVGHSGPYPVTWGLVKAHGRRWPVRLDGRDRAPASVDQPKLTEGSWVRNGGAVVEAAFAAALGIDTGDRISLDTLDLDARRPVAGGNERSLRVVGVAVTAASAPFPEVSCLAVCAGNTGLIWLARTDLRSLDPREPSLYVSYLKLADPDAAPAFAGAHMQQEASSCSPGEPCASDASAAVMQAWQDVRAASANLVANERRALVTGAWLLAVLAVASVAVLVGGRMADQVRRVGLLKAVGGTPSLVATVLLAEYVLVALVAAAVGLALGWLTAPLLTDPSAGLLGRAGAPPLTISTVVLVTAVALGVAVAATFVPAVRAARTSTVRALADSARASRRTGWLVGISARLPVPLMLGLRVAARRPRRVVLATASIGITVSGVIAALSAHADVSGGQLTGASVFDQLSGNGGSVVDATRTDRLNHVLLVLTVTLLALAAVNAIFITWATALDARRSSALARALGANPQQVGAGLSAAQVLPALVGAALGVPGGIALIEAADPDAVTLAPLWQMVVVVVGAVLFVAALTAIPARLGARRPVVEVLASEHA